jgi:hypothetical protein
MTSDDEELKAIERIRDKLRMADQHGWHRGFVDLIDLRLLLARATRPHD